MTVAAATSLVACAAVAASWALSYRGHHRVGLYTPAGRFTLHSHDGRLTLTGPPPAAPDGDGAGQHLVRRISNDQLQWFIYRSKRGVLPPTPLVKWHWAPEKRLPGLHSDGVLLYRRSLLRALEDPDKFAIAHMLLQRHGQDGLFAYPSEERPDGTVVNVSGGLRVELVSPTGVPKEEPYNGGGIGDGSGLFILTPYEITSYTAPGSWRCDPSQMRAIRDHWHARFDVTIASVAHRWAVGTTVLLPLLWLIGAHRRAARRRRREAGICLVCGYDVRFSPERCPECGSATATPRVSVERISS